MLVSYQRKYSVAKFAFAFQVKAGRARPGGALTLMVVMDLLDCILELSSMLWGFSLFKDNIYMRSECNTSVTTSFVTTSSCS